MSDEIRKGAARLPKQITPKHYAIRLEASPKRKTFTGRVVITAKVSASVDRVTLHARDLTVEKARIKVNERSQGVRMQREKDQDFLHLIPKTKIGRGPLVIDITFKGKLNPSMHSLYQARDGQQRALVSQCEAADARGIFPCFDEPEFKAKFEWTVVTDAGLTVVTNGAPTRVSTRDGRSTHRFSATKAISSYLAAISIGKFEATPWKNFARTPTRVVVGEGALEQTGFAEDVTGYVLPWFGDYFGQRYPFGKLEQVAVPGFDAGAMENVGAIFYRQSLLLCDPRTVSWASKKRIAEVIAHEISHQWFGNLVTMKWWDDLWLNEAFATWVAYKAIDSWKPDWRMWDDYLESKESALGADALKTTHPIYSRVETPAEATELFDLITYEKGCGVVRMIERFVGDVPFRRGIQTYLKRHKNKNATGEDLWRAVETATDEPVAEIMENWITQPGFPVIRTQLNGDQVHLEQERFFLSPKESEAENHQLWTIPLLIRYQRGDQVLTTRTLFRGRSKSFDLPGSGPVKWVYPNAESSGFFRLNMDDDALDALLREGLPALDPGDRKGLLEDQWAMVRSGESDISRFMDVVAAYRDEEDYSVVRAMARKLKAIADELLAKTDRAAFAAFILNLFGPHLDRLGWRSGPGEGLAESTLRATVIEMLGLYADVPQVRSEAGSCVEREVADPESVGAELAVIAIRIMARYGGKQRLERYVEEFQARKRARTAPELQARYLRGIAAFERREPVEAALALCLTQTIPQEQLGTLLQLYLTNPATNRMAWKFMTANWPKIGARVGLMGVSRLLEATGGLPYRMRREILDFFKKNPVDEAQRALHKAIERMTLREELASRERAHLGEWLNQRQKLALAG